MPGEKEPVCPADRGLVGRCLWDRGLAYADPYTAGLQVNAGHCVSAICHFTAGQHSIAE
jgi:hypothetical protein